MGRCAIPAGAPNDEKGAGICHGTAGNGYALLKTFERTGDELWLERARALSGRGRLGRGFPAERLIFGLPFYSSANDSWPALRETWATNRAWFSNAVDAAAGEVRFAGRWWTTPECVQRKMSSVLDTNSSVLMNRRTVRGVGFWEFGHQDVTKPDLTGAIKDWFALRTNVFSAPKNSSSADH